MDSEFPRCVALVTPAWPPGGTPNGIVTYTAQIVPALRTRGVRPIVLAWKFAGQAAFAAANGPLANSDVVDIGAFQRRRGLLARALVRGGRLFGAPDFGQASAMIADAVRFALSQYPIELVEMEEASGLAGRVADLRRVPVVARLHGPWFLNGEALGVTKDAAFRRRVLQERDAILRADGVTAPSRDVLERTRAHYGIELNSAQVIPYPLEFPEGEPPWRLESCEKNRIAFIGRFDLHKGADVMIDAFVRLASAWPDLQLDFIGPDRGLPGPSGVKVTLPEFLAQRVTDPNVRGRIVAHGQQPPEALGPLRRRALVTVVPSRYETFGYTALEAMSLGCPLVASNRGGLAEIVQDERTGLLFPSENAERLASQIDRLLSAPVLAAQLGERGRLDVRERYSPTCIADQTLDFYACVIGGRRAKRAPSRDSG